MTRMFIAVGVAVHLALSWFATWSPPGSTPADWVEPEYTLLHPYMALFVASVGFVVHSLIRRDQLNGERKMLRYKPAYLTEAEADLIFEMRKDKID